MKCGCGNTKALRWKVTYDEDGNRWECCDGCGKLVTGTGVADVYFKKPYFDEHLTDKKHPHGQWVESRSHKAHLLKVLGLREAGSDANPVLGYPQPFIKDVKKRRKFFKDNFEK